MNTSDSIYLGDGVYVSFDGYHIWLETDDGYGATNRIALEDTAFLALKRYGNRVFQFIEDDEDE